MADRSKKSLVMRAVLAFLALPAVFGGVVPWALALLTGPRVWRTQLGWGVGALGSAVLISTVISFYQRGKGTLAPWDPPTRLVVTGLYRSNRNPMYVGVVLIVLGWALGSGSLWNWLYAPMLWLAFHLRVVYGEEQRMAEQFGAEWSRYRASVPRWGIRIGAFEDD